LPLFAALPAALQFFLSFTHENPPRYRSVETGPVKIDEDLVNVK
jgi:hypothetical protein